MTRGLAMAIALLAGTAGAAGVSAAGASAAGTAAAAPPAIVLAVLPLENFSDAAAPSEQIHADLRAALAERGIALLEDASLQRFMGRHRVRYIGGIAVGLGKSLRAETGATAVLLTSIDLYAASDPPKLALTSRLVSIGDDTRILWMDSAARSGDQAPGFLGLGRIADPLVVRREVIGNIAVSLERGLAGLGSGGAKTRAAVRASRRFRPRATYRSTLSPSPVRRGARVALLPFSDDSATRHAGEIVSLQMVRSLLGGGVVEVVEPGVVREALLGARVIQDEGISTPQADLLKALLDVDVVVFGEVTEYIEPGPAAPEAEIAFAVRAIDTATRQVIWSSVSHGRGDRRVFFFGLGRVPTAHALAGKMTRGILDRIFITTETPS